MKELKRTLSESLRSVLPISAIVLLLSITAAPLDTGTLTIFLFGTLLLVLGMSFFTIGSNVSMEPLGGGIGKRISKARRLALPVLCCFFLGLLITVAEPDLTVLAHQIPSVPNWVLILSVGLGVGVFLAAALLRIAKGLPLSRLLIVLYLLVFILACFAPKNFVPVSFDSGGVTTGPITVPFLIALGVGLSQLRGKHAEEDSFGLVALCSIGPILSVLILSILYKPSAETGETILPVVSNTLEAFRTFSGALPRFGKEVLLAFVPILGVFVLYALLFRDFAARRLMRSGLGFVYTFLGLVLFLVGANIGFMPAGRLLGAAIASGRHRWLLIPIGMLMGYFVVSAEPAVHTLKKQVEEVTNGAISQRSIGLALSIGVGCSVGLSMLRVLSGIPLLPFLLVGYGLSLLISLFVPPIYTGIAFDSGGVASGPMTTTFVLPFAVGACEALGGNVMTDAFGVVAMVAMTPLISIQVLGLLGRLRKQRHIQKAGYELSLVADGILYYDHAEKEAAHEHSR